LLFPKLESANTVFDFLKHKKEDWKYRVLYDIVHGLIDDAKMQILAKTGEHENADK